MEEIWKDIKGYEGLYQVSNMGNVKSLDRYKKQKGHKCDDYNHFYKGKILSQGIDNSGYKTVILSDKKSTTKTVHRLVAETFILNPNNYPCVNHKDGNKKNNNINNLEWCSYSYNIKEAYRLGLKTAKTEKNIKNCKKLGLLNGKRVIQKDLKGNIINIYNSTSEASRLLNLSQGNIWSCCVGRRNKTGGYKWEYFE